MNNKLNIKSISVIMVLVALSACAAVNSPNESELEIVSEIQSQYSEYNKITAEEAYRIMNETDDYILLDVRTDEEYNESHIEGAVLIPDYEIETRAESELPDKNALILVYCRSGRRSAQAAKMLLDMGYTDVYDFGGIIDWVYDVKQVL